MGWRSTRCGHDPRGVRHGRGLCAGTSRAWSRSRSYGRSSPGVGPRPTTRERDLSGCMRPLGSRDTPISLATEGSRLKICGWPSSRGHPIIPGLSGILACSPSAWPNASKRRQAASASASAAAAATPSSARACTGSVWKPSETRARQSVADGADRHDDLAGGSQTVRDQGPLQVATSGQGQAFVP